MRSFDLIVIGAGPGGYTAAIRGAQKGLKTAVIEARDIGGVCLNRGCIPTKSMLHSARLYREALDGGIFGLRSDALTFDFDQINKRKIEVVEKLRGGTEQLIKSNKIEILRGFAKVKTPKIVTLSTEAGEEDFAAKYIIIAVGAEPKPLPIDAPKNPNIITTDDALALDAKLYKRILISGGGVIGVEFASMYNDLGSEVTIVGSRPNLLRRMDGDISKNIMSIFKKRGISIITPAKIKKITERNGELFSLVEQGDKTVEVASDGILVCVGRKPLTEAIFMDGVDVKKDSGFIEINENMQTNIDNIYAIGDCTMGSSQLAHAASAQGLNAVAHIVGEALPANLSAIPTCVYTSPEIAAVGMLESEAVDRGFEVKTGKYLMGGNGKSIVTNEDRGFIKLIFDAKTDILLGAHITCARATDIISELASAVANKLDSTALQSVVRPHPTYVEGITEAVEDSFGMAIHMLPKKNGLGKQISR